MIGTRTLFVVSAFALLNSASAIAQETSSERDARTQSIINDQTGKYAWVEDKEWYVAKTCRGRENRFVFAKIGQTLFRFPRKDVRYISAPSFVQINLADGRRRNYFPSDYGCRDNPISADYVQTSLPPNIISIDKADPTPKTKRSFENEPCRASKFFERCSVYNGHGQEWVARDATATTRSGGPLGYTCGERETCSVSDKFSDGIDFTLNFRRDDIDSEMPIADLERLYDLGYAAVNRFRVKN